MVFVVTESIAVIEKLEIMSYVIVVYPCVTFNAPISISSNDLFQIPKLPIQPYIYVFAGIVPVVT